MQKNKKRLLIAASVIAGGTAVYLLTRPVRKLSTDSLKNANQIGLDLGTAYPFFDPRSWTENDQAVEDLLQSLPASAMPQLQTDYRNLFKRDLIADLQKNLSGWDNISHKFSKSLPGSVTKGAALLKKAKAK